MISKFREWVYRLGWIKPVELPAVVVSVGNLSMGGTGKSPMVMLLADWAAKKNIKTLVLSRGYKRKSNRLKILLSSDPLPAVEEIGDEPWMIRHRCPKATLLVHPDRARMAKRHWKELDNPKLVLLDDGFQHWRVKRDKDILLIDATDSLHSLPFGRLREGITAVRRADLIILTKIKSLPEAKKESLKLLFKKLTRQKTSVPWKKSSSENQGQIPILLADYAFSGFFELGQGKEITKPKENKEYLLLSGIARPDHFRSMAHSLGLEITEELYFPDHHILRDSDKKQIEVKLKGMKNGALLLNEKDWARWREFIKEKNIPGVGIRVHYEFLEDGEKTFQQFLQGLDQCFI